MLKIQFEIFFCFHPFHFGDSGCGKTCLISRYVHNKFDFKAKATIACEYALKLYDIGDSTIRLNIWDIAGQDSVGGINKLFCRQAAGALVVCDLTDQETLENAVRWKKRMDELCTTCNGDFPVVLVCNKYDLVMEYERDNQIEDYMTQNFLDKFSELNGFACCLRVSAKENINVEESFKSLIEAIIENNMTINKENGTPELNINKFAGDCRGKNSFLLSFSESISTVPKASIISKKKKSSSCCK